MQIKTAFSINIPNTIEHIVSTIEPIKDQGLK